MKRSMVILRLTTILELDSSKSGSSAIASLAAGFSTRMCLALP